MYFDHAFISIRRIRNRKSKLNIKNIIIDSGAFTTIDAHGGYPEPPEAYAALLKFHAQPGVLAAVAQDYMCEAHMLKKTGLTIPDHQRLTIERYDALMSCDVGGLYILPVLQGYAPEDYVRHIDDYGERLRPGMWVGVGSVCKRNGDPSAIEDVLFAVKRRRPDLRLHGFGIKTTAIGSSVVRGLLYTADSMSWSFAARREGRGRDANDWREAKRFERKIYALVQQKGILYGAYCAAENRWRSRQIGDGTARRSSLINGTATSTAHSLPIIWPGRNSRLPKAKPRNTMESIVSPAREEAMTATVSSRF